MAQQTVLVRKQNNRTQAVGRHCTLTNVRNDTANKQQFGFAVTDEGEEVYVPALVIRGQQMTEADIGAGFTCPLKQNPRAVGEEGVAPWVALNPIEWDDQAPEIKTIEMQEHPQVSADDVTADLDALVNASVEAVDLIGPIDETFQQVGKIILGLQHIQTSLAKYRDQIKKLDKTLDEVAPEQ